MRKLLLIVLLLPLAAWCIAPGHKTTRRPVKAEVSAQTETPAYDTIQALKGDISFRGYDKPLNTSKETLLATNNTTDTLQQIELRLTYTDLKGRPLHQRKVWVSHEIPPGQVRMLHFKSWDVQRTFYYAHGPKPRRDGMTPYLVTINPLRYSRKHEPDTTAAIRTTDR